MEEGGDYRGRQSHDVEANNISIKEGQSSLFQTVLNGINTIIGNGILVVPYALATGGWLSLSLLFSMSITATYSSLLIKRCMEVDPRIKSYSDIGEYAFGRIGKIIIEIIIYLDIYIVDTSFLLVEGDNLHKLFPNVALKAFGMSIDGKSSFIIIIALVLLPTVLLDNLSILAYLSASGVVASFILLGSVAWVGAFDGIGFHSNSTPLHLKGIPAAISLYMMCYDSHPVFPALYISMQKKHHFSKALILCFSMATIIYFSMAVLGYLMFGSEVQSQITLSLPTNNISSQVAIYITLISPLLKYALMLKPVVICTESWLPIKYQKNKLYKFIIRTILVATHVIVALSFPFFRYLMALAGALLSSTASLTVPCLCYLRLASITSKWGFVERIFIWAIVILSVFIAIYGTSTTLVDIIGEYIH